jgi:3D (Asp-Asp-Asp) domain-containing protein
MKSNGYFSGVISLFNKTLIAFVIAVAVVTSVNAIGAEVPTAQSGWTTIAMRVTAYCPCEYCCGEWADGVTANGHEIEPGDCFVAADRRFPFDTEMLIEGYNSSKIVKVFDRGGAIKGNKLDVFFHTHQEALEWGVRYIDVKIKK